MEPLKATAWPEGEPFRDPPAGAFTYTDPPTKRPRFMRIACAACRLQALLPIAPHSFTSGESFAWDGNREQPTIVGLIECLPLYQGCGRRGQLRAGEWIAQGTAS